MPNAGTRERSDALYLAIGSTLLAIPGLAGPLFGLGFLLKDLNDGSWRQFVVSAMLLLVSGIGFVLLVGYWRGVMRKTTSPGRLFWGVSATYNAALLTVTGFLWATTASEFGPHQVWFALFAAWLLFAITVSVRRVQDSAAPSR